MDVLDSMQALPAFSDNYIWTWRDGDTAYVVDPGDARPVEAHLQQQGLALGGILITHHHPDHVGGVARLRAAWPDAPVWMPAEGPFRGGSHPLRAGDRVQVGSVGFQILATPGHTLDHICYLHPGTLFCGDTLFAAGCGRLFEGTPTQMHASLQQLAALPADTRVYCTHEYTLANLAFACAVDPQHTATRERQAHAQAQRDRGQITLPSNIALECATNPFLRVTDDAFRAQLQAHELAAATEVEAFASLRAWKDRF